MRLSAISLGVAVDAGALGAVDRRHATDAERLVDDIGPERLAGCHRGPWYVISACSAGLSCSLSRVGRRSHLRRGPNTRSTRSTRFTESRTQPVPHRSTSRTSTLRRSTSSTRPPRRGALEQLGDRAPAARVALRAARLAHHRGDDADAARAGRTRARAPADEPSVARTSSRALGAELAEPPVDPNVVAVLLPLSRPLRRDRHRAARRDRARAADGTSGCSSTRAASPRARRPPSIPPSSAGAIAILGPSGTREAIAAARAAALHDIPIALLAPADGADPSAGVFRLVDSPGRRRPRGRRSSRRPTTSRRSAVFAPRDDVGQEAADAFVAEAQRRGLSRHRRRAPYDPTGGDLEPDVKQFLNLVPAKNPRLAEHLAHGGKKGVEDVLARHPVLAALHPRSLRSRRARRGVPAVLQRRAAHAASSPMPRSSRASTAVTCRRSCSSSAAPAGTIRRCRCAAAMRCRAR